MPHEIGSLVYVHCKCSASWWVPAMDSFLERVAIVCAVYPGATLDEHVYSLRLYAGGDRGHVWAFLPQALRTPTKEEIRAEEFVMKVKRL